jgi:hypothetical protein
VHGRLVATDERVGEPRLHRQGHQLLLRTVVDVSLEAEASGGCVDDVRPSGAQLGPAVAGRTHLESPPPTLIAGAVRGALIRLLD